MPFSQPAQIVTVQLIHSSPTRIYYTIFLCVIQLLIEKIIINLWISHKLYKDAVTLTLYQMKRLCVE